MAVKAYSYTEAAAKPDPARRPGQQRRHEVLWQLRDLRTVIERELATWQAHHERVGELDEDEIRRSVDRVISEAVGASRLLKEGC